jgi:uncharacterized membrane protein
LLLWFLTVLPIGIWVVRQHQQIHTLARRINELEQQLFALRTNAAAQAPAELAPDAAATPEPEAATASPPQEEPLLLTEVVPDDVLVLDNPLPEPSNDAVAMVIETPPPPPGEKPRMHSPLLLDERAAPPVAEPERVEPPPKPPRPSARLDQWLAEKGLAWLAGIALAMGAIYLVSVAVQSGWFTPALRIGAAVALGAVVLGVSEWTRRIGIAKPPGHPLMSALLAGAGIVVLYAATWGALAFGLISWGGAAALLALCAIALIGLSFLHGEALGVLAIMMALLAPAVSYAPLWPSWLLTVYLGVVASSGFALSALRRWPWVSVVGLTGLYFWFFQSIAADEIRRALTIVSIASLGGVGLALRPPLPEEAKARLRWSNAHGLGPSLAVSVSSVLLIWAWLFVAPAASGQIAGPALIAVFHVALAAYAVRGRVALPATLAIATGALVIGFMSYLQARFYYPPLGPDFYPTALIGAFVVAVSALASNPHRSGRKTAAGAGGIGAALLTWLAAASRGDGWHSLSAWLPLFAGAALLFACAWWIEPKAANRKADAAIDLWAGAGAVLALAGVESAFGAEVRTAAHAAMALLFAIGLTWRGWRAIGWASLTAAMLTIGHALSPALIGPTLAGQLPIWQALLTLFGAAALLFAGSTVVRRTTENIGVAEALSAAAAIVALVGVFVGLRWVAAGGAAITLDGFTETSLRVLTLMAAGLILLPRIHETPGWIGAWRGHVLLGAGLIYALLAPGYYINPWWGAPGRAVIDGWPLLNTLALAFAAPAALAFVAANRLYARQKPFARIYAAVGGWLALLWLVLEIRHAFHNDAMAEPAIGLFESACYALAMLAFALGVAIAARMRAARNPHRPFTQDLMRVMRGVAWAALAFAVAVMLLAAHPIWGAQDRDASNALSTLLAAVAQIGAMGLALALARALSVSKDAEPTRFTASAVAALFAWSAGHCIVRWEYHRGYMDNGVAPMALEGLLHAVWPLALVIGAAHVTRLAPGRDTVRAYLHDLQAIWASAIWPTLAFAGLGLWLIYTPWWGIAPAQVGNALSASVALSLMLGAAALSYVSPDVPHARWVKWLVRAATIACAAHIFVAATLAVRWLYHGAEMSAARAGEVELWVYSAVWALLGAVALTLGTIRSDPVLRWVGLALFFITIVKVFVVDTARLSETARGASFIILSVFAGAATWLARRNRPPPSPGDLVTIKPSARRERRRVRRRTSP